MKQRRFDRRCLSFVIAMMLAQPALAVTDSQRGSDGSPGIEGSDGNHGGDGTAGGNGDGASADATSSDPGNSAEARGGDGGMASLVTVYGESIGGGKVPVYGSVTGGSGGSVDGDRHKPGNGASVRLIDAVDGRTTGSLSLEQAARGGGWNDGSGSLEGTPGSADSSLSKSANAASLSVSSSATGGRGQSLGAAGESHASAINDAGGVESSSSAYGGEALRDGGDAVATATGRSNSTTVVRANAYGGDSLTGDAGRRSRRPRAAGRAVLRKHWPNRNP